jgi:hypothetical protein
MIYALCAAGGFVVGALAMWLFVAWINRRAENKAFRAFWG